MKTSTAKRRINKVLDELTQTWVDSFYAQFKDGYIKGYADARQGVSPMYAEAYATADTPQTDLVKESPSLVKDLVNAFCEDGTWLERQGVYTLTLAEAKQRAVDIIEAVSRKDTADTPQTDCGWK